MSCRFPHENQQINFCFFFFFYFNLSLKVKIILVITSCHDFYLEADSNVSGTQTEKS